MAQRRFLLITRAGGQSLHEQWLQPAGARNFDLLVSHYGAFEPAAERDGVREEYRPGRKVAGYAAVIADHRALIEDYEYVALFDDDLAISADQISRLFEIAAANGFKICQPALTYDSYFTYGGLLRNPAFRYRHVNFIEMMCPVMRSEILLQVSPLFEMGLESGIDLAWCNAVFEHEDDFAVIDEVAVTHTRPIGQLKHLNGFGAGERYEDDIARLLRLTGLPWLSCVPYSGVATDGSTVRGRARLALLTARILPAAWARSGWRQRLRAILTHIRHVATRPARNIPPTGWSADACADPHIRALAESAARQRPSLPHAAARPGGSP